jgi:hypothetical protein
MRMTGGNGRQRAASVGVGGLIPAGAGNGDREGRRKGSFLGRGKACGPAPPSVQSPYIMPRHASPTRIELRASAKRRARYRSAAERRGLTLSEWARRHLDDAAEIDLAAEAPAEPSAEDVTEALRARGTLRGSELRARLAALRETPWS